MRKLPPKVAREYLTNTGYRFVSWVRRGDWWFSQIDRTVCIISLAPGFVQIELFYREGGLIHISRPEYTLCPAIVKRYMFIVDGAQGDIKSGEQVWEQLCSIRRTRRELKIITEGLTELKIGEVWSSRTGHFKRIK